MMGQKQGEALCTEKKPYKKTACDRFLLYCLCTIVFLMSASCGKKTNQEQAHEPGLAPAVTQEAGTAAGLEPTKSPEPTGDAKQQEDSQPSSTGSSQPDTAKENADDWVLSGTADEILECFQERTLAYAKAMLSDDFSVCGAFSEELLAALSERDMKAAWKQAVQGLGKPLSSAGEETEEPAQAAVTAEAAFLNPPASGTESGSIAGFGGYVVTSAQIPYRTKIVILTATYDKKGAVAGIYLTYTLPPVQPEETEAYTEYEVEVGKGSYPLSGLLTLPSGVEKPPVVLFVHGSGQSDKNETTGAAGNAPFADLAHGLAEQGIATLRYDKRYYQYPELAADDITIQGEVLDDAAAAIAFLAAREDVDTGRIYVLGHSLGGMLAPCIVQENPQAAGLISLAGSPRGLWEIVYDQHIAAIQTAGLSGSEEAELIQMLQEEYDKVLSLAADVRSGQTDEEMLREALFGVSGHYWASLAEIDSAAIAQELEVPMLILQGEADFQVYPDRDYGAWQALLADRENVSFRLFEGLNHLFMPSNGAMDITEYDEEGHVAQEVIDTIADWVKEQETKDPAEKF